MGKFVIFTIGFLVAMLLIFQVVDFFAGPAAPGFNEAPRVFCETRFAGITLPPFGIFICPDSYNGPELRAHELVHWNQYEKHGFIGFYVNYLKGYIESDFSYENHPMEIEAGQRLEEFMNGTKE